MGGAYMIKYDAVFIKRMGRQIDADILTLQVKPLHVGPRLIVVGGKGMNDIHGHAHVAEERIGGLCLV